MSLAERRQRANAVKRARRAALGYQRYQHSTKGRCRSRPKAWRCDCGRQNRRHACPCGITPVWL